MDLLALDLQGFLCVYPGRDEKSVGAPIPLVNRLGRVIRLDGGFGLGGRCSLWAGPWTAPGRVDLLVGLPADAARFVLPAADRPGHRPSRASGRPSCSWRTRGGSAWSPGRSRLADGRPLVVGVDGCSPSGVAGRRRRRSTCWSARTTGTSIIIRRDQLRW